MSPSIRLALALAIAVLLYLGPMVLVLAKGPGTMSGFLSYTADPATDPR